MVGLRDLFDSDSRSKADLRREIGLRDEQVTRLEQQLAKLQSQFVAEHPPPYKPHSGEARSNEDDGGMHLAVEVDSLRTQVADQQRALKLANEEHERKRRVLVSELEAERQRRKDEGSKSREEFQKLINALEILKQKAHAPAGASGGQVAPRTLETATPASQPVVATVAPAGGRAYYSEAHRLLMQREDRVAALEKQFDALLVRFGVSGRSQVVDLSTRFDELECKLRPLQQEADDKDLDALRGRLSEAQRQLRDRLQELNQLRQEVRLAKQRPSVPELGGLRKQLDDAQIQIKLLKQGQSDEVWKLKGIADSAERNCQDRDFQIRNLQIRIANLERTNASLTTENTQLKQANVPVADHNSEFAGLRGASRTEKAPSEIHRKDAEKLQRDLHIANDQVARLQQELAAEKVRPIAKAMLTDSPFANPVVLRWLVESGEPESAAVPNGWLGRIGEGPWSDAVLANALEDVGYKFWVTPDGDLRHLIVGREGWAKKVLLEQIDAVNGEPIRIYSQEMFLAKLITGRDPFDCNDSGLLMAFARGHPALEFLLSLSAPWPTVSERDSDPIDPVDSDDYGVSETPLHKLGYHVGATSSLTVAERRRILTDCLEAVALEFTPESSKNYRRKWGRGGSAQRLYRIAVHIKLLTERQGLDLRRPRARADWISDLDWLRKTYYAPVRRRFTWP